MNTFWPLVALAEVTQAIAGGKLQSWDVASLRWLHIATFEPSLLSALWLATAKWHLVVDLRLAGSW